jgi:hypothetical protein
VLFGGGAGSTRFNDVWTLELSSTIWIRSSPAGTPPLPRADHVAVLDPPRDRMVVWGGSGPGPPVYGDVWVLALSGGTAWAQLEPIGTPPLDRMGHSAVYDPVGECMAAFGGYSYDGNRSFDDLWMLTWIAPRAGVRPMAATVPSMLTSVHPNPSRSDFSVTMSLLDPSPARLEVFDLAGRRVIERDVSGFGAGRHVVRVGGAATLPPGLYLIQLTQGSRSSRTRVVILR